MMISNLLMRVLAAIPNTWLTPVATPPASTVHFPSGEAARENAFAIFNSIHSAMRQWGSSVNHNGLSFYLTQAPEGSIFYHGDYLDHRPRDFEWLAFEFEHAYMFGRSWEPPKDWNRSSIDTILATKAHHELPPGLWRHMSPHMSRSHLQSKQPFDTASGQQPLVGSMPSLHVDGDGEERGPYFPDPRKPARGYFHTYRANRPLNLLYIDGQAAAKAIFGPMDSQDLILLDWSQPLRDSIHSFFAEVQRGVDMCDLAKDWTFAAGGQIDGFIRMEAGFEIIYCDFSAKGGLDLLSLKHEPFRNETALGHGPQDLDMEIFEWLRASAERFHGHPAGRVDIDWSSMVSAFAYPVNVSNPDMERQDLPRIVNTTREERRNIRARLRDVIIERGGRSSFKKGVVNWQALVDKIATRFSSRLWYMANAELNYADLLTATSTLIDPFIDYFDHGSKAEQRAVDRCSWHYFDPALLRHGSQTPEDEVIEVAIRTVLRTICSSLFSARSVMWSNRTTSPDFESPTEQARHTVQSLNDVLRWSTWRECATCGLDEICSIPMFPMGSEEDYFHPRCRNITSIIANRGYWGF